MSNPVKPKSGDALPAGGNGRGGTLLLHGGSASEIVVFQRFLIERTTRRGLC